MNIFNKLVLFLAISFSFSISNQNIFSLINSNRECEGLSEDECFVAENCLWDEEEGCYRPSDEGIPECLQDCPGVNDINPQENPDETCDWVVSTLSFVAPGFVSCFSNCDEETTNQIYEVLEACYECLQSDNIECSDIFNNENGCEGLTQEECADSEFCAWSIVQTPNGVFEICIDSENMDDGGWNDDGGNEDDGGDFEGCAELTQDECIENPECEWGEMITPNGFFEVCFESGWNDGGDDGGNNLCSDIDNPFECYGSGCNWEFNIITGEGYCVDAEEGCLEDGEFYCIGCELFLNECDYLECTGDGWIGPFTMDGCDEGEDDGNNQECSDIDNPNECYNAGCEWMSNTPFGDFGICVEPGTMDDGGNFEGCAELTQDECTENPECDWSIVTTPNGVFEMCIDVNDWNDDGGWQSECEGLSYEDCEYSDFCEWISDSDNPNNTGFCIDAGGPNPCSDFNQEDCEWYDECVWTDQGCQDYDWNDDCNPDMICGQALTCVDGLLYPTTCGPENCDDPIGVCDDEGPPDCLLDCPGIEDINPSEDPYEACDWVISTLGNDPGFASCFNDCDEETVIEIYEIIEACFECLSDMTLDCSDVFNDDDCSDLSMDECIDAEGCQPNYNAAGQFEGCEGSDVPNEGCYENGEWFCYGCELFLNECDYLECTENGWVGPFTMDECGEGDFEAVLNLENVSASPNTDISIPLYITSNEDIGGLQFEIESPLNSGSTASFVNPNSIVPLNDCFYSEFNIIDNTLIVIMFSLEGCTIDAGQMINIANLNYYIPSSVDYGQEIQLEFGNTIVSDQFGNEIPSYGESGSVLIGIQGDINSDGAVNVSDIVLAVSFAISSQDPTSSQLWAGDVNNDGIINVLDIVTIVNIILD